MATKLIIATPAYIQKEINLALKSKSQPGLIISINKPIQKLKKLLKKSSIDTSRIFFIDLCSKQNKTGELSLNPKNLEDINEAIDAFSQKVKRRKFLIIDDLATFLVYNKETKIIKWVKSILTKSANNNFEIIILSHKPEGNLLTAIFNFFDKVKIE